MCLLSYLKRDRVLNSWKIHASGKFFKKYEIGSLIEELKCNVLFGKSLPDEINLGSLKVKIVPKKNQCCLCCFI